MGIAITAAAGDAENDFIAQLPFQRTEAVELNAVEDDYGCHAKVAAFQAWRGYFIKSGRMVSMAGLADVHFRIISCPGPPRAGGRGRGIGDHGLACHQHRTFPLDDFGGRHGAVVRIGRRQQAIGIAGGAQATVGQHVDGIATVLLVFADDVERKDAARRRDHFIAESAPKRQRSRVECV